MKTLRVFPVMLVAGLLAACVTINVYFPAAAAEQAADRIIQDVWGRDTGGPASPADLPPPGSSPQGQVEHGGAALLMGLMDVLLPTAQAAVPNLDISSPAIRQITASMESRHSQLRPWYEAGAVGLGRDGQVSVRDQSAIALAERNRVRKLVADENADRQALYRQIAIANGHPEWEGDIRDTFAQRWVANARGGWYYQDRSGNWVQK